jgi:hypothetical protein
MRQRNFQESRWTFFSSSFTSLMVGKEIKKVKHARSPVTPFANGCLKRIRFKRGDRPHPTSMSPLPAAGRHHEERERGPLQAKQDSQGRDGQQRRGGGGVLGSSSAAAAGPGPQADQGGRRQEGGRLIRGGGGDDGGGLFVFYERRSGGVVRGRYLVSARQF